MISSEVRVTSTGMGNPRRDKTEQKNVRLSVDVIKQLDAYRELFAKAWGIRMSEAQIIQAALVAYFRRNTPGLEKRARGEIEDDEP